MSAEGVGEVCCIARNLIKWTIPSFTLLLLKKDNRIWSPSFVQDVNRRLFVPWVPEGFIGLSIFSKDRKETLLKCVRFGIADINNSVICCSDGEWNQAILFVSGHFEVLKFVCEKDLKSKRGYFKENSRFRLFCEVVNNQECKVGNAFTRTDNSSVTHDARCSGTDEESEDNVKLKEEGSNDLRSLERLSQNLKQLYIGSKDCDLTIQVQDREFKVHRAILRARSSVFDAMFTHGLSESNSGVVPIEDSEPAIIEEFLCFVYAGRTENLSSHNACELYYVADKYDVPDLKEKCISFLKKSLSVEAICDVICLATKHNETELLEHAILFFAKYMEEILVTVKWQVFLRENPTEANELYIKALKLGFSKRNI